jgi:hypothetical protein
MGLGRWLRAWWDNPLLRQTDPDRIVQAARVPLWVTPLVMTRLEEAGIRATAVEESRYPGGPLPVPTAFIHTSAAQKDAAVRIIDEVTDGAGPVEPTD